MRRSEILIGAIVLGAGVLFLIGAVFDIDVWGLLCPAGLIVLGGWLIYRTRQDPREGDLRIRFVGDIRRSGMWRVDNEETWGFVFDTKLDFTQAEIPVGETSLRMICFVNDIKVTMPAEVGIAVYSLAFMTEARINDKNEQVFVMPYEWKSDNYEMASKKIILKPSSFVSELRITQVEPSTDSPPTQEV